MISVCTFESPTNYAEQRVLADGLAQKSHCTDRSARSSSSLVALALKKITGISCLVSLKRRCNSNPSIFGIRTSSMSSGAPQWLFPDRVHVRLLVSSIWQHARMQVFTFFIKSAREGFPSFHVSPNRKSTSEISLGVQTFLAFLNSNERAMAFASFSLKATL